MPGSQLPPGLGAGLRARLNPTNQAAAAGTPTTGSGSPQPPQPAATAPPGTATQPPPVPTPIPVPSGPPPVTSPPPGVSGPPPMPTQNPQPAATAPNPTPQGANMSNQYLAAAQQGGSSRAEKMKEFVEAVRAVVAVGEDALPTMSVVVIVDGKLVSGDVEEAIRGFYNHVAAQDPQKLNIADKETFVALSAAAFGDTDSIRKAAGTVFDKKGA